MPPTEAGKHPIQQAQQAISSRPLCAIDFTLLAFKQTVGRRSDTKARAYLDILARAVISASEGATSPGDEVVKEMLKSRPCDRLACASLLRLLIADDTIFADDARLRDATALFDRSLAKSLYPKAGLTEKDQAYEKRDRLRTLVAAHEADLATQMVALGSLDAIESFRSDFNKRFRDPSTRVFVTPFLPPEVGVQAFEEILSAAQALGSCNDASLVGRAKEIEKRCEEMRSAAGETGTDYARKLVGGFADRLRALVKKKLAAAGFADPAKLEVSVRPKRYPFGEAQVPVTVRIDLTNAGPGQAQDVAVHIEGGGSISFDETTRNVGLLSPSTRQVDFDGIVVNGRTGGSEKDDSDVLIVEVTWRDPDGDEKSAEEIVPLMGQQTDIPWDDLKYAEPYPLGPVEDIKDFVGRRVAIRDLVKVVLQSGSARIQGEKRVGKTSLAYAASAAVEKEVPAVYRFLQFEAGDFSAHTPEATIARLGELIAVGVRESDPRLADLGLPDFSPGLTTLTEFFGQVGRIAGDLKFVIVLDEFDAMPHGSLYRHEPIGDAFFGTLRSLGGKHNVSFILIGAERMQWVIATHGQTLNKFRLVSVDYFGADQLSDYAELVRAPVSGELHFSEEAIQTLYEETAGNPWMTKLLLSELFDRQVERRDQDVQVDDVHDAIDHALPQFAVSSFQHFWDDAILGEVEDRERVSATRRRIVLALARRLQLPGEATEDAVVAEARNFNVDEPTVRDVIREFLDRRILLKENNSLACRVPLFEQWLARYGPQEIILGTGDEDTLIRRQRAIEEMRPRIDEMAELAEQWKSYRGREVRPDQIIRWLEQFGGPEEQRLLVPILSGLTFYSRGRVNQSLRDLHQWLVRELASRGYQYTLSGKQRHRSDLLVCGLEGGGSGAASLLKQYRDENNIYRDCVVDPVNVPRALKSAKRPIRAVLIVEDFMGTGKTAASQLKRLHEEWTAEMEWPESVDVFLLAITAFDSAVKHVEVKAGELDWPLTIRVADALGDEDRCFNEHSRFYPDVNEREKAEALCAKFGSLLSARTPLGYGETEAAICFEYRCPNNTLPIIWNRSPDWEPLFPRI